MPKRSLSISRIQRQMRRKIKRMGKHIRSNYRPVYDALRTIGRMYFILSKNSGAAHYARKRTGFSIVQYGHKFMVSHRVAKFSLARAKQKNLDEAVAICRKAKIQYSYVPGFSDARERILVFYSDRHKFLDVANRHLRNKGYYITDNVRSKRRYKLINGHGLPRRFYRSDILFLFHLESKNSVSFANETNRCDIEFWFDENEARRRGIPEDSMFDGKKLSEIHNCWISPTSNRAATILTPEQREVGKKTINNKQYDAFLPFTKRLSDELDINFPIDVVYTWVDGDDPRWMKKYDAAKRKIDPGFIRSNSASRYTSRDELKYSLRGLAMYAPWVRHIYIVTDDQMPKWLKEDDRLRVVPHREIFKHKKVLPVFNSHAIESQLHNIPGLADRYIYLNDDIMITNHIAPLHFFNEAGIAKLFPSRALFGEGDQVSPESIPSIAGANGADLLNEAFGVRPSHKFAHAPHPQLKNIAQEVAHRFSVDMMRTERSKFRSKTDISPITLINHYSLITGKAIKSRYRISVIDISKWDNDYAHWILHHRPAAVCLNDTVDMTDEQKEIIEPMLRQFLNRMLPFKSPWEK